MADEAPKKKGGGGLIVAILILTLIGGGGGAGLGFMLGGSKSDAKKTAKAEGGKKKAQKKSGKKGAKGETKGDAEKVVLGGGNKVVDLPVVVTNLSRPSAHWVRLEASLIVADNAEPLTEVDRHSVAQDALVHLRQTSISELDGATGLKNLLADLTDLARLRTEGRVKDVIVRGLIVE